ncbi:MAG: M48 family metallopeptidase, partial [Steroidobacteraceae bacterium]
SWTFTVSFLVVAFIGIASAYKTLVLRGGGGVVARSLGGVRVDRGTEDPLRRRLLNVVEEMSIASGVPMPEVYVLEREASINAFAAGHTPANAAIGVTQGTLQQLNREQLQGVVAHEFSHVLNGDMRLSLRLMGLVFGLLAVAMLGRLLLRVAAHARKGAAPFLAAGGAVIVIGYVGLACGRFIQAWISRKRESLADASAVQFTRNPDGLKEALLRAAAQPSATVFTNADTEEVGHMLFLSAGRRALATHPSLFERLQELQPGYTKGQFESEVRLVQKRWEREAQAASPAPAPKEAATGLLRGTLAVPALGSLIAATVGDPGTRHIEFARMLRKAMPMVIQQYAKAPESARVMMCAMLLSREDAVRAKQMEVVKKTLPAKDAAGLDAASSIAQGLEPILRLPSVLRLFPVLRQLPDADKDQLRELLDTLASSDARIDVFEFALTKLVSDSMQDASNPGPQHGNATIEDLATEIGLTFAVLARHGAADEMAARQAYEAGIAPLLPRVRPGYECPASWAEHYGGALDALTRLRPAAKELLIGGLVRTIAHDGQLAVEEAELLRTICAVLQCPMPPVLPPAAG